MSKRKSFIRLLVFVWVFMAACLAYTPIKKVISEDEPVLRMLVVKILVSVGVLYLLSNAITFLLGWAFGEGKPAGLTIFPKWQVVQILGKVNVYDSVMRLFIQLPSSEHLLIEVPYVENQKWLKELVVGHQYTYNGQILEPMPFGKKVGYDGKVAL